MAVTRPVGAAVAGQPSLPRLILAWALARPGQVLFLAALIAALLWSLRL